MNADNHAGTYKTPGQYVFKGVVCGGYINKGLLENPDNVDIRDGDVFVITYPKSGTTWTQEIVSLVLNGCDVEAIKRKSLILRAPFLEWRLPMNFIVYCLGWILCQTIGRFISFLPKSLSRLIPIAHPEYLPTLSGFEHMKVCPHPRHAKSHLPVQLTPLKVFEKGKIIYVARNPKDTAVSFYHFYRSTLSHGLYKGSWEDFLKMFMDGQVSFGDWFDHVIDWWKYKDHPNVLYLKYEDMQQDPHDAVRRIAKHLDKTIPDDLVDVIVRETSFDKLKGKEFYEFKKVVVDSDISPFFRKGIVGDWENYFTVAQNAKFEELYEERMRQTDLTFDW
ncbi:sulfotransferase 1B1-like [Ptychodera flava]|uniref:sulfotransferase 1B1-like n=1 Tax=Ptychodera flava TaxID=63121 RepID=UPI00396AAA63